MAQETTVVNENGIIDNLVKTLVKHKKVVIAVVVTAFVVGAIFAGIDYLRDKSYQDQWSKLFMAELSVANGGEETSYAPLEEFATKYKGKPSGVYASFVLGTALSQQEDFLKAEIYFKQALEGANEEFTALITNSRIANAIALEEYSRAIEMADAFILANPAHFSIPQITLYKALALELKGDIPSSQEIYKTILEDYPNTYYSAIAQVKLGKDLASVSQEDQGESVKPEPAK